MAGIRGQRSIWPKAGGAPTGILSTNGKQKQDGMNGPEMGTLKYSHGNSNDANGTKSDSLPAGKAGKRHQAPVKQW